jgi:DegV family protein with EDD domain
MQIAYVDGPRLRRSLVAACEYAQQQRSELNRINVFPVPDGDTGTNLALTLRAIADSLSRNSDRDISAVASAAAEAAVLGARGNCGMMLSHFLLGFAAQVRDRARISTAEFGEALTGGVQHLYEALEKPVEGTILTVMRDTATAAGTLEQPDFAPLIDHMVERARDSLARTPDLLPALKKAGVVDAGAKGFVSLLEGVLLFMNGDPIVAPQVDALEGQRAAVAEVEYPAEDERYRFCTEALVRGSELPDPSVVKAHLREMGDSLIVIRTDEVLKIHVHTDEPEEVFEYLRTLGTLATHKAEDMKVQHETLEAAARRGHGHVTLARRPVSIVTDSASDLPEDIARAHGIQIVPLMLIDGDTSLRDRFEISAEEFHERMRVASDTLPSTSQPAPTEFISAFERAAEEGEEVIAVLLGSSLSGTFASAEAAAKRFHGAPIHLFDTLGISLMQSLFVIKAAELAELGTPPAEIIAELKRIRKQSSIHFTVDTFDRLLASGRVGRGRAALGSVLNIKPVLGLDDNGVVMPYGKAIGRTRVIQALVDSVSARIPQGARKVRFGIIHVARPEIVPVVTDLVRKRYGDVEVLASPATPVISTHLGVGAWGLSWIVED